MHMTLFQSGSPPYAPGEKVAPTSFRWSDGEITAPVIADAVEAVFSDTGADVSLYQGSNDIEFSEKLYVRGSDGNCIISTFDNEDEETGYFIDRSRDENDRIEIKGDLWGATTVCCDRETLTAILSDYAAGRDLTTRDDWEVWTD